MIVLAPLSMKEVPSLILSYDIPNHEITVLEATKVPQRLSGQTRAYVKEGQYSEFVDHMNQVVKESVDSSTDLFSLLYDLSSFELDERLYPALAEKVLCGLFFPFLEASTLNCTKVDTLLSETDFNLFAAFNGLFGFKGTGKKEEAKKKNLAFFQRFADYLKKHKNYLEFRSFFSKASLKILGDKEPTLIDVDPSLFIYFLYRLELHSIDLREENGALLDKAGTFQLNEEWEPDFCVTDNSVDIKMLSYAFVAAGCYQSINDVKSFELGFQKALKTKRLLQKGSGYYLSPQVLAYCLHNLEAVKKNMR